MLKIVDDKSNFNFTGDVNELIDFNTAIKTGVLSEKMLKELSNKEATKDNFKKMNDTIKNLSSDDSAIFSILLDQILTENKKPDLVCQFDMHDINQIWLDSAKNKLWGRTLINEESWEFLSAIIYNYFKEAEENPEEAKELLNIKKVSKFEDLEGFLGKFNKYFKENLENVIKTTKSFSEKTKKNLLNKYNMNNVKNDKEKNKIVKKYNQTVDMIQGYKLLKTLPKLPQIVDKLFKNKVKTK